jgi:hypothetical protein
LQRTSSILRKACSNMGGRGHCMLRDETWGGERRPMRHSWLVGLGDGGPRAPAIELEGSPAVADCAPSWADERPPGSLPGSTLPTVRPSDGSTVPNGAHPAFTVSSLLDTDESLHFRREPSASCQDVSGALLPFRLPPRIFQHCGKSQPVPWPLGDAVVEVIHCAGNPLHREPSKGSGEVEPKPADPRYGRTALRRRVAWNWIHPSMCPMVRTTCPCPRIASTRWARHRRARR